VVTDFIFPVFVTEPTDPTHSVDSFDSLSEMEASLEAVDVENEEYCAWDAEGLVLRLEVQPGPAHWLRVTATGMRDREGLLQVIASYAVGLGLDVGPRNDMSPAELLRATQRADEARKRGGSPR